MTRVQFLNDLYRRLGAMTREEAEQHLTYYAEMLADRIEEGMTEEEAVASMEDVDTIARRILQDAGIRTEGAKPTVDETVVQAMGQPETPKRSWVKPVVILLSVAFGVALLLMVLPFVLFTVNVSGPRGEVIVRENGVRIDVGNEIAAAVTPGQGNANVSDRGDGLIPDVVADTYSVGTDGIRNINIEWVSGVVLVEAVEGDEIVFTESATGELEAREKLTYTLRNGELTIQFCKKGVKTISETKNLTVQIPASMTLNEVEVGSVSAGVEVSNVNAGALRLETTSGDCLVTGDYGNVSAETVSGNVVLQGNISAAEMESVSGDLAVVDSGTLDRLDTETTSGDVRLTLPAAAAFDLHFETASGDLDSGSFTLTKSGRQYRSSGGGSRFEVETVSGNLYLTSEG